uniref:Apoptosis facilitator Bcl-2-like protein 14 n=1 Tax=Oncorhynchus tshawytscha TaxID=74940 RepID=A0AAZ3SFT1_ONCTS
MVYGSVQDQVQYTLLSQLCVQMSPFFSTPSTQTLADLTLPIMSNHILQRHLQTSFTYSLFETVTSTLLQGKEERVQREKIALACEVTSKLSALDLHPMSRAMGFGTRYLQEHHTAWVKKHGGWVSTNNVFDSEDTD